MYNPGLYLWFWRFWWKVIGCVTKVYLCVLFVSIINSKFFLVSLAEELKPACPSQRICFKKSDPGVSPYEHCYLSAGAVPPSSHPEVPNLVLHLPYIHHQGNTCTNSLSSIWFIFSLPSNWQENPSWSWAVCNIQQVFFHLPALRLSLSLRSLSLCYNWT